MLIEWDEDKNRKNFEKHGIDFETASLVFDDLFALTKRDLLHQEDEDRYITLGAIGFGAIVFVVHTYRTKANNEDVLRMISARSASRRERKIYEEAHQRKEKADRHHRRKDRRRD
jgi:uncharacterized DUF497 family protein